MHHVNAIPMEHRILVLAPSHKDGEISQGLLSQAGLRCELCPDLARMCDELKRGAGVAVVTEESMVPDEVGVLLEFLRHQPAWSDQPLVVLMRGGMESPGAAGLLETLGNVMMLERPVRVATLISAVRTALRARVRQYQLRDQLATMKKGEEDLRASEKAEREARASAEEARINAETASRAKDQFLAVLSHELRTPLSPVLMSVASMLTDKDLPVRLRPEMAMVRRNIELETKLIDDLLDLSRVINGKLRVQFEPTHVHELLKLVLDICLSDALVKRQRFICRLDARCDTVMGDPARLQQVFWNLIKNALKFSQSGSEIIISTRGDSQQISIDIQDVGVGIPGDVLERIFDAFEQGDPRLARKFGGLGLGLAISKAVVDLHGGTIKAESPGVGKGAKFTVALPVVTIANQAVSISEKSSENNVHPNVASKPLQILLVEDHPDTARIMARLLREEHYEVAVAGTISEAIALADTNVFDLLISDLGLPDGTGHELMRRLKREYGMKGIAMSGYGMESDIQTSRAVGFCEHVVKPVSVERLKEVIRRVVKEGVGWVGVG